MDISPKTTNTGGMSNISFIENKLQKLGKEGKSIQFYKIVIIICIDIQRVKFNEVHLSYIALNTTTS